MRTLSRLNLAFVLLIAGSIFGLAVAGGMVSADPAVDAAATDRLDLPIEADTLRVSAEAAPDAYAIGPLDLSPEIASALLDDRPMGARAPGNTLQQVDPITEQSFEDEMFPPEFWATVDLLNEEPQTVWGRETCTSSDGDASVWGVGGGALGDSLDCTDLATAAYTSTVVSLLRVGAFDVSGYPGGLRVAHDWLLDLPRDPAEDDRMYEICALWPEGEGVGGSCAYPQVSTTEGEWARPTVDFDTAAGRPSVTIAFIYSDEQTPTGEHFGAFIDDVAISGLETTGPPPRVEPAFLPMAMNQVTKEEIPDSRPIESGVVIHIGTAADPDGRILNRAEQYETGTVQLCQQVLHFRLDVGTVYNVDWVINDELIEAIRSSFTVETPTGAAEAQCIVNRNEAGDRLPLPEGEYVVQVTEEGASEPLAEKSVEITEDVPPGATPIPTQPPPTPTPVATPEPGGCRNVIANSSFEGGPYRAWSVNHNLNDPAAGDPANVIIHQPDNAATGEWLARLWGGESDQQAAVHLIGQDVELYEPSEIVSATLQFNFGLFTEEESDDEHTDVLQAALFNPDEADPQMAFGNAIVWSASQGLPQGQWLSRSEPADITELMTKAPGYERAALLLRSIQDFAAPTTWVMDDIQLVVCTQPGVTNYAGTAIESTLSLDPNRVLESVTWPAPHAGAEVIRSSKPFDRDLIQGRSMDRGRQIDTGRLSR